MALLNTHTSKRILPALLLGCLLAVAPLAAQDRLFNRTDSLGRRSYGDRNEMRIYYKDVNSFKWLSER